VLSQLRWRIFAQRSPRTIANFFHLLQDTRVRDIGVRVMNEIVTPFRDIRVDDTEYACLKAIVFFDPNARGLTDVDKIKRLRYQIQVGRRVQANFSTSSS